ncbi:MAG: glycosyltransferase [Candidatus Micrarchaeota archaeon]
MRITVGIAAYNEERVVSRSIFSALESQPRIFEVIVVASGCTDGTENAVRRIAKSDHRVRLIAEKERRGKGSAINLILKRARGDVIVMTDADLTFPKKSIGELVKKLGKGIGAVSGRPEYFASFGMFSWWGTFASECASRQREKRVGLGYHAISGYLYAVRRGIVRSIPPHARSEDAYVGEIVRQKGHGIGYAPRAIVNVGYPENIIDYLNQKIRTHYGHLEVFRKAGAEGPISSAKMAGGLRGEIKEYFRVANSQIKNPLELAYFCAYIIAEVAVWMAAFMKYYTGGSEEWKQIGSTKKSI